MNPLNMSSLFFRLSTGFTIVGVCLLLNNGLTLAQPLDPSQTPALPTNLQQGRVEESPMNSTINANVKESLPSYSIDSPSNIETHDMKTRPYNNGATELNLWQIENKKFIRSDAVLSPNRRSMAYSEVIYMPHNRQTFSRLYLVGLPKKSVSSESRLLPEDYYQAQFETQEKLKAENPPKWKFWKRKTSRTGLTAKEIHQAAVYNPDRQISNRKLLLAVGQDNPTPSLFETLTVVDWSADGNRLLFKRRSGILYLGLKTSDILVYDEDKGTVTVYPELHRVISHFWNQQGTIPNLKQLEWDIFPMGWEPGSSSAILFNVWAFDKKNRKFLGLWRYDVDSEQTRLLSLQDISPAVAANGVVVQPQVLYNSQTGQWVKKGQ